MVMQERTPCKSAFRAKSCFPGRFYAVSPSLTSSPGIAERFRFSVPLLSRFSIPFSAHAIPPPPGEAGGKAVFSANAADRAGLEFSHTIA